MPSRPSWAGSRTGSVGCPPARWGGWCCWRPPRWGTAGATSSLQLSAGLFLLGLGWSFGLVSGSTLVSESVPGDVRTGVQGASDLVMGLCGASGGALAGVVVGRAGYDVLNALAAALVVALALFAGATLLRGRPTSDEFRAPEKSPLQPAARRARERKSDA